MLIDVLGQRTKAQLFVMRLMHSGRDFAWLYERQDEVSFLDGHIRAFAHFGAVPQRVAYDNLLPSGPSSHGARIWWRCRAALVTVEGAVYSAPCEWAGYMITAHVGATQAELVSPRREEAGRIDVVARKRFVSARCTPLLRRAFILELKQS